MRKWSDSVIHPPSGSNVPGKVDPNPYIYYPPDELRRLRQSEKREEELEKIDSALKQWERIYQWPGYPWKKVATADKLRFIACMMRLSEIVGPAQNIPYYQDSEIPEGIEDVLDGLYGLYDQYNIPRFDIPRQGERPERDIDTGIGDFSTPKMPVFDCVRPMGDGADPEGMEVPLPPTGGDIEGWPEGI